MTEKRIANQHHMSSMELAANLFCATQTEEKLKRENAQGKKQANSTYYEVGTKVCQTIQELGGVMPEGIPAPSQIVKQIESNKKKLEGRIQVRSATLNN